MARALSQDALALFEQCKGIDLDEVYSKVAQDNVEHVNGLWSDFARSLGQDPAVRVQDWPDDAYHTFLFHAPRFGVYPDGSTVDNQDYAAPGPIPVTTIELHRFVTGPADLKESLWQYSVVLPGENNRLKRQKRKVAV